MVASPVIDADGHVVEPFWIWQEYLASEFRDAAPRLVELNGREAVSIMGVALQQEFTIADFATPGGLGPNGRTGRSYDEIDPAAFEPVARLQLMDRQRIDAAVLYPSMLLNLDMFPDGLRQAMNDAYHRWMADFCASDPTRLKWAAPISRNDVAGSVKAVERAAELGAAALFLVTFPTLEGTLLGDPAEDQLYDAISATGLPLAVHAADPINSTLDWGRLFQTRYQWDAASAVIGMMFGMLWLFSNGLLDRFPSLRVAFLEGNVGWFPYFIDKLRLSYDHMAALVPAPQQIPLEQFRERCWISGETEESGLVDVARLVGAQRCLWSSDYPHYEADMDPLSELTRRNDLSEHEKQAIVTSSALSFYGFDETQLGHRVESPDVATSEHRERTA